MSEEVKKGRREEGNMAVFVRMWVIVLTGMESIPW